MPGPSLIEHFAALEDPRQSWKVLFPLPEVLLVVLWATLAGAEDFVEIRRWGQMHQEFLRRLLPFKAGVPSHNTLNDVINALDGALFAECFTASVEDLREPPSLGAGCRVPRGPQSAAIRRRAAEHGHRPAHGHEPTARAEGQAQPQDATEISRLGHTYLEALLRQSA